MSMELPYLQQVRNTANVTLDVILANMDANSATALAVAVAALNSASIANAGANTNANSANSALAVAEAAYSEANTALALAETIFGFANTTAYNTNINTLNINAGYGQANTALAVAEAAYGQANTALSAVESVLPNQNGVNPSQYGGTDPNYGNFIPVLDVNQQGIITAIGAFQAALFGTVAPGVVPGTGGLTDVNHFLNSSGTWTTPSAVSSSTLSNNGYIILNGGLIIQWGRFTTNTGTVSVNFPISFPNACFAITQGYCGATNTGYFVGYPSTSGFSLYNGGQGSVPMSYIAIGH